MSDEHVTQIVAGIISEFANLASAQALQLDPVLRSRLATLDRSVLQIECTQPSMCYFIEVDGGTINAHPGAHQAPHAIVSGTLLDLASWFGGRVGSSIRISGDETLVDELVTIGKSFSPDLDDPLRRAFGPEATDLLRGTAELGLRGIRTIFDDLGAAAKSSAASTFVDQTQFDAFLKEIDELRLRVDRLAARISGREQQRGEQR